MAALDGRGVSAQVSIPSDVYILLDSLQVVSPSPLPAAGPVQGGEVTPAPNLSLLGFATFAFDPGLGSIHLDLTSDANSFTVDLNPPALALPASLVPARFAGDADGGHLEALPGTAHVVFTDAVGIRVSGSQNTPATVRLVLAGQDDVVASVSLQGADGVLFGTSGFGLRLPNGLVLDDSGTQVPPPATAPHDAPFASEAPEWRGIAIRGATLFLPAQTPLLGSTPIGIDFELGSPRGLDARIQVAVPAQTPRPAFKADIEWHDPTATSLGQALPTLLELTTEVTVVGQSAKEPVSGQAVTLAGGKPLRLRGRFSRDPQTEALGFDLSVEGVGAEGLIAVSAESGDTAAKVFVTAAALATALVADSQQPSPAFADGSGVALHFLLLAAAALSSYAHSGQVVVHGVEVGGDVRALGDQVHLRVDYSVDVVVTTISLGVISVEMNPEVPLRIRYRDVALVLNLPFQGVDSFNVSFHEASVDVEDPGGWIVNSPGSVLDVIGTRSGHGSSWFEVDLRFALDLGLVKVSGATIRAFFGSGLVPKPSLRGLDAQLNLPAFITGEGLAQFTPDGLDIGLAVRLPALGLGAMGFVGYQDQGQFREVLVDIGVDLPAPIPLANTGLGIFGLSGLFAINGTLPDPPPGADPIDFQLQWRPNPPPAPLPHAHVGVPPQLGGLVLGLGAVLGTVPDLGYAFSTKAMIAAALPDLTVRAALEATFMNEPPKMAVFNDDPSTSDGGARIIGLLVIGPHGIDLALRGTYDIPVLLHVVVPVAAHFSFDDATDWFLHVGADGFGPSGGPARGPGPVQVVVLPGLLNEGASGYLMLHGHDLPNLGGLGMNLSGFSVGFGFAINFVAGGVPVLYAELDASLVAGIGTHPVVFLAHGTLDASLHLGPFTLGGIQVTIDAEVGPGSHQWLSADVCGEVDLWLVTLRGCISLTTGSKDLSVPDPGTFPLTRVSLVDVADRELDGAGSLQDGNRDGAPTVWPDAVPVLEFSTGPDCALNSGSFLNSLSIPAGGRRIWVGPYGGTGVYGTDELQYTYTLTSLDLVQVDPATGAESPLGDLPAQWQLPRHGDPSTGKVVPGARELALLTWERLPWTRNLLDGGASVPDDPVGGLANGCHQHVDPTPSWDLGIDANRASASQPWSMPPETVPLRIASSRFDVSLETTLRGVPVTAQLVYQSGLPFAWDLGGPAPLPSVSLARRTFGGHLVLPHVVDTQTVPDSLHNQLIDQRAVSRLDFGPPLIDALVCITSDVSLLEFLHVQGVPADASDTTVDWNFVEDAAGPNNGRVRTYAPDDHARAWLAVEIAYPPIASLGVLGVRGTTPAAVQAAANANAANEAAAKADQTVAATVPPKLRDLLQPGSLYKLTVGLTCIGQRKGGDSKTFGPNVSTYWFKTAPLPAAAPQVSPRRTIFRAQDNFDPSYLERYQFGYTPDDKTAYWFPADPVAAHFSVDHVAPLAELYGHKLTVRVTRTDTPAAQPDPGQSFDASGMVELVAIDRGSPADQRLVAAVATIRAAGEAPCAVPGSGSSLVAGPLLAKQAHYDLDVFFPTAPGAPGAPGPALPGVVFSTSRYQDPGDLLTQLGFSVAGPVPTVRGDVRVQATPIVGNGTGDSALEDALARLGLTPWPNAPVARTSALWVESGADWLLRGVLMEAPEPLFRPGPPPSAAEKSPPPRFGISSLSCSGGTFDVVRQNASRTALLWLASTPFVPAGPLVLQVVARPPLVDPKSLPATTTLTGSCQVGPVPPFVADIA